MFAQAQPPAEPETKPAPEMTTQETPVFRVRVNQVLMRVVVRDRDGKVVEGLTKDDFEIRDNGKPQKIASFNSEKSLTNAQEATTKPATSKPEPTQPSPSKPLEMPQRFVGYLFDDLHLDSGDLLRVHQAAERHLATLAPGDRAAIFTTSGQGQLDFTDDRDALLKAVRNVHRVGNDRVMSTCPWMSYYFADLIVNKEDRDAIDAGVFQVATCMNIDPSPAPGMRNTTVGGNSGRKQLDGKEIAKGLLLAAARDQLRIADRDTHLSALALDSVVKRMSVLPGQRMVVMVSPGYLVLTDYLSEVGDALDRALRANVIVHTLDARGLYTDPSFEADFKTPGVRVREFAGYVRDSYTQEGEILGSIAAWTGGTWFHNNNDLEEGFRRTAAVPELTYLMAFTPENLKYDGSFHNLKVAIKRPGSFSVTARRGYSAPKKATAANEAAEQEVEEAFFSSEEMQGIGLGVSTHFFKPTPDSAALEVVARVDANQLPFRKDLDRHVDRLIVASGLFDPNGLFIEGIQKTIDFRLKDETLKNQLRSGISVKSRYKVKPGGYLVRVVVRDSEGQLLSAKNSSVEIP
jgi:VWFA-related protein